MGRVQAVILGGALALVLASCGGDDGGGGATPQGFQRTETADFSLALPDGWQVDKQKDFIEARPPGADINRAQLRIATKRDYQGDINAAMLLAQSETSVRRAGATKSVNEAVTVPGAADARRLEFTVPAAGGIAASRIVTVLALTDDRTLVNMSVGVNQSDPASAKIDAIVGSLKVG